MKNKVVIAEKEAAAVEELNPKGIPEFWFTIFRNVDMLSELVQVRGFCLVSRWVGGAWGDVQLLYVKDLAAGGGTLLTWMLLEVL